MLFTPRKKPVFIGHFVNNFSKISVGYPGCRANVVHMPEKIVLTALTYPYAHDLSVKKHPGYADHWIYARQGIDTMPASMLFNRLFQHRLWIGEDLGIRFGGDPECGEPLCLQPQHYATFTTVKLCSKGHLQEGENLLHYTAAGKARTRCRQCHRDNSRASAAARRQRA